jgi:20S proteasome alpha/beta subunit
MNSPEGVILAAESRVTLSLKDENNNVHHINFDNATKLLSFSKPHNYVGAVTYGLAAIGQRTVHSFLPEFEASLPHERIKIDEFAKRLSDFFMVQWQKTMPADYKGPNITLVVGGFNDGEPYGCVYIIEIPNKAVPELRGNELSFGITWGGQREFVDRLIRGYDNNALAIIQRELAVDPMKMSTLQNSLEPLGMKIALPTMALQDCVDLAIFFIRTTIIGQSLTIGLRGCGGPIDVATITRRDGFRYIQKKSVFGEVRNKNNYNDERLFHSNGVE